MGKRKLDKGIVSCAGVKFGILFFFFKQKTAYEIGTGDWSSDVCSSDLLLEELYSEMNHLIRRNQLRN